MIRRSVLLAVLIAMIVTAGAGATTTTHDANGSVLLDGSKVFPIVLAKGPDRGGTTLDGHDAIAEVIGAGVTFLKIGPATVPWTDEDIADAKLDDADAAAKGGYTWVNLSTVSRATAGVSSTGCSGANGEEIITPSMWPSAKRMRAGFPSSSTSRPSRSIRTPISGITHFSSKVLPTSPVTSPPAIARSSSGAIRITLWRNGSPKCIQRC